MGMAKKEPSSKQTIKERRQQVVGGMDVAKNSFHSLMKIQKQLDDAYRELVNTKK